MSSTTHATKCCNVATQVQVGLVCRGAAVQIYRQLRLVLDMAVDHDLPCAWDFNLTTGRHGTRAAPKSGATSPPVRPTSESESDSESPVQVTTTGSSTSRTQAGSSGSLPTWTRNLGGSLAARTFRSGCRVSKPRPGPPSPPPRATTGQLLLLKSCYLLVLVA
jgi:hypothetical protein